MRRSIVLIIGTIVLTACSAPASSSDPASPSASLPIASPSAARSATPSPAPSTTPAPTEAPTPSPEPASVVLAETTIGIVPERPVGASCTAGDSAAANLDRAMTLAGTPFEFQYQSGGSRTGDGVSWSDSVPGPTIRFGFGDRAQIVETSGGTVARLEPASSVTLVDGTLDLYRLEADDTVDPNATAVAIVDLGGDASGLDVPMPTQTGRWLLSVYAHWQTECAAGDGYVDLLLITS